MLKDEVERHNDSHKYRRTRRNRKRYRAPRFNNRVAHKKEGWLAPSLRNKKDQHVRLLKIYNDVLPITSVVIEVAQFDTQLLKAVQDGAPLPSGTDYQHGERYGYDTLREAVFARDGYTCIICKRNAIKDNIILRVHHVGFWKHDRTNRLSNLATVCTKCHTSQNHKPNGKLYGLKSISKTLKSAAFMNSVKYQVYEGLKAKHPNVILTFGTKTKRVRNDLNISKTHANDAYCMGEYRPKHRAHHIIYEKRRRNNRVLEKFYDSKYFDIRDNSVKSGSELSCGRTNRSENRCSSKNERIYRGVCKSKGRRQIRKTRYDWRPHDIVKYDNTRYEVSGIQNQGAYVKLIGSPKVVKTKDIVTIRHTSGWYKMK